MKKFNKAFAIYIIVTMMFIILNQFVIGLIPNLYLVTTSESKMGYQLNFGTSLIQSIYTLITVIMSIYYIIQNRDKKCKIIGLVFLIMILLPLNKTIEHYYLYEKEIFIFKIILNIILAIVILIANRKEKNEDVTKFQKIFIKFTYIVYSLYFIISCYNLYIRIRNYNEYTLEYYKFHDLVNKQK